MELENGDTTAGAPVFRRWSVPGMRFEESPERQGVGALVLSESGALTAEFTYRHPEIHSDSPPSPADLVGATDLGVPVRAVASHYTSARFNSKTSTTLIYVPTRCVFGDQPEFEWTRAEFAVKNATLFGSCRFTHGPLRVTLTPRRGGVTATGSFTSKLIIESDKPQRGAGRVADDICRLLTVAQRCPTPYQLAEYFRGDRMVAGEVFHNGWEGRPRPLVPWDPVALRGFFARALPRFSEAEKDYNIGILAEYFWRAHSETTAEIKFLLASVFMEALKFYWAKNVAKLQPDLKANGLVRGFLVPGKDRSYSFETLIRMAAWHLRLSRDDFTFIDNRNAIFHTGVSHPSHVGAVSSWPELKPELYKLFDQMDEILLTLLGYEGEYHPYAEPDAVREFTERAMPC